MPFFVLLKETPCWKTIVAIGEITFEWFLSIVDSHMSQEISLLPKSFFTAILGAHKRSLASLYTNWNRIEQLTCNLIWILSLPALEYLLLQPGIVHTNGFSPVWVSSWAYKWPLVMNFWLHSIQTNGLSPVWVRIWVFRFPVSVNSFKHFWNGHNKIFFSSFGLFIFSNCSKKNQYYIWKNTYKNCFSKSYSKSH